MSTKDGISKLRSKNEILVALLTIAGAIGLMFALLQVLDFLPTDQYFTMRDDPNQADYTKVSDRTMAILFAAIGLIIYMLFFQDQAHRYPRLQWVLLILIFGIVTFVAGHVTGFNQVNLLAEPDGREAFWTTFQFQAPGYGVVLIMATIALASRRATSDK